MFTRLVVRRTFDYYNPMTEDDIVEKAGVQVAAEGKDYEEQQKLIRKQDESDEPLSDFSASDPSCSDEQIPSE